MNKFLNFGIILNYVLFTTVLEIGSGIVEPFSESLTYNPMEGIIQWICYAIACFIIIFSIIKFIRMLKSKKPIWKCILFLLIMIGISYLLVYFTKLQM